MQIKVEKGYGNMRFVTLNRGDKVYKQRIPLHIYNMPNGDLRNWNMEKLVNKLLRKASKGE